MDFLDWLFGKSDTSLKSHPSFVMEIVKGPPLEQGVIVEIANNWKFKDIGNVEPVCPYCNYKFDKMPQRKKECPNCKKIIFSRTRLLDNKKVLLTEDQLPELEAQLEIRHVLSLIKRYINTPRQQKLFNNTKTELTARFGKEPTINDVFWGFLNKETQFYESTNDWGLYINAVSQQAELLNHEGKFKEALEFYLWACYLDINGPNNLGGLGTGHGIRRFDPEMGFLAPGNVQQLLQIGKILNLSLDDIKTIFLENNKKMRESLKLPISPNKAWLRIEKEALSPSARFSFCH